MAVTSYDIWGQVADGTGFSSATTAFSNIIKVAYEKPFLDSLDQDTFIFNLFKRKDTDLSTIRWKVKVGGNNGSEWYEEEDSYHGGIGPTGAVQDTTQQKYASLSTDIKMARILVKFSNLAKAAKGAGWVDIQADETEGSLRDFKNALNDSFMRFDATLGDNRRPESLGTIIGDGAIANNDSHADPYVGSQTYGNYTVDGAASTRTAAAHPFSSYVNATNAARPLTTAQMNQVWAVLQRPARAAMISDIISSPSVVDSYGDIADNRRRWPVNESGRSGNIDLSYSGLAYKGVPLGAVQRWPTTPNSTTRMYFLDKSVWNVHMLKAFDTSEVPPSNDTTTIVIKTYLQLVCKAPYKQAVICDLSSVY